MKKFLCMVLTLVLFASTFETTIIAVDNNNVSTPANSSNSISEEKIICNANISEDFQADSIVVALNNSKSRELNEYTPTDFSDVSAVHVDNLSIYTTEKLKQISKHDCQGNEILYFRWS